MTILVANVDQTADTFGQWLDKTNQIATALSTVVVTANSNTTPGNVSIGGTISSSNLILPNTGIISLGTDVANAVINVSSFVIQTSGISNNVLSSTGMVIDGLTQYTKGSMALGNTIINGSNVSSNTATFTNSVTIGSNVVISNTSLIIDNIAASYINVYSYNAQVIVGEVEANTIITKQAIQVFENRTGSLVTNSYMNSTDLYIQNIYANNITLSGSLTTPPSGQVAFSSNVEFSGANTYFDNGFTSNGISTFIANVNFNSNLNGYGNNNFYGNTTFYGANNYFINGLVSNTNLSVAGFAYVNTYVYSNSFVAGYYGLISNGAVEVNGNLVPQYRMRGSSAGQISFYDSLNPEGGVYNYTLNMDNYAFRFAFSKTNTPYDYGYEVATLDADGNFAVDGNVISYRSDARLKTVVSNIPNALDKVMSINGVIYKDNEEASKYVATTDEEQVGVLAQEIQKVLPQAVKPAPFDYKDGKSVSGENYLTVQYEKLVPLLIEAIKELKTEVDRLKNGH